MPAVGDWNTLSCFYGLFTCDNGHCQVWPGCDWQLTVWAACTQRPVYNDLSLGMGHYYHEYLHDIEYIYTHIFIHTYIQIHIHTHTHTYIHTYTYTYIYIYTNIYTYIHTHTYIHTYIYTPTYTPTYTHICTYITKLVEEEYMIYTLTNYLGQNATASIFATMCI